MPYPDSADESEVRAFVDRVRETSARPGVTAVVTALDAVEQALAEWRVCRLEATRCEEASRIADDDLAHAACRLRALLAAVAELQDETALVTASRSASTRRHAGSAAPNSRWRRLVARWARGPGLSGEEPSGTTTASAHEPASAEVASTGRVSSVRTFGVESEAAGGAELSAKMFGTFAVWLHGQAVNGWRSGKAKSVLRYLLAHRDRPVSKEALQEMLWPSTDPELARRNLHQAVYTLRRNLRPFAPGVDLVLFEHDCYLLNADIPIWRDIDAFEGHTRSGRRHEQAGDPGSAIAEYRRAIDLYVGDYLEDAPYDDWTIVSRNRLRIVFVEAAHHLGDLLVAHGDLDEAIGVSQRMLHFDPADEVAHRRIMSCQHARGQRSLAIRQYWTCVHAVRGQFDLPPSAETSSLFRLIQS